MTKHKEIISQGLQIGKVTETQHKRYEFSQ